MEKIDEKYFSKYVAAGSSLSYKDTLAAAAATTDGKTGAGAASSKGESGKGERKRST